MIEHWRAASDRDRRAAPNKSKNNLLVLLHGDLPSRPKVYGLPANPVATVERHR